MLNFLNALSFEKFLIIAVVAYFLTKLVLWLEKVIKFVFINSNVFEYKENEFKKVFEHCCVLFPKTEVEFKDKTFTRGMSVRIITNKGKSIAGKLVGLNNDNFICLITTKFIAADTIENVKDILPCDEREI